MVGKVIADWNAKAVDIGFKRELPASFRIETEADDQDMNSDCCNNLEYPEISLPEKNHMSSVEKKRATVEQVRSLAREGFSCRRYCKRGQYLLCYSKEISQCGFCSRKQIGTICAKNR